MRRVIAPLAAIAIFAAASPAEAMSCSILSVTPVSFGSYDVFDDSPLDGLGGLSYSCTGVGGSDTLSIHLDEGGASSFFPRKLSQGAYELSYNLYTTAARTVVFGDGTSGTSFYGPVTPNEDQETTVNIYGRIPAKQNAHVGGFSDTVVVTLVF